MALTQEHLDELVTADAQGERALISLWPGDQFYFRGAFHEVHSMQWHTDQKRIYITTTEEIGDPVTMTGLGGVEISHQSRRTFLLYGMATFPAMLSDEHFAEENPQTQEVW